MDRYPANEDPQAELELWEPDEFDKTSPASVAGSAGRGFRGRVARSLPGAAAASFLIAAMAFGAVLRSTPMTPGAGADGDRTGVGETADKPDGATDGKDGADNEATDAPDGTPGDEPGDGPDGEPTGGPDKTPAPTDAPKPEPTVASIALALHLEDGHVRVDWGACETDGFRYYKVVRSFDEKPTWPLGDGDKLVAAIEDPAKTALADGDLPLGKKLFYRVFALATRGDGVVIVCQSPVRGVAIPAPTPKPEPTQEPTPEPTPKPEIDRHIGAVRSASRSRKAAIRRLDRVRRRLRRLQGRPVDRLDRHLAAGRQRHASSAAVGPDGKTAFSDKEAPAGKKLWYRVFCVDKTRPAARSSPPARRRRIEDAGQRAGARAGAGRVGFEVGLTDGGVVLHWESCGGELFRYYKVVRSRFENPSYLPGTDGSRGHRGHRERRRHDRSRTHEVAAGPGTTGSRRSAWMDGRRSSWARPRSTNVTVE